MTVAVPAVRPPAAVPAGDGRLEEILRALDPGFLSVWDWDWKRRVITFPRVHPVVGLPDCPVPNCPSVITVATRPMCWGCMVRQAKSGMPLDEFLLVPKSISAGIGQQMCAVDRRERPQDSTIARLCATHRLQRSQALGGLGMEEFLAHPKVVGLAGIGPCLVTACYLDRVGSKYPYYKTHTQRLRTVREEPGFDGQRWRRTDKAVCSTREVSLRGLPDRLVAEAPYALSSRVDNGYKLRPECLRPLYDRLRAHQVTRLGEVTDPEAAGDSREQATMIRAAQLALARLNTTPETERVKDVWDMSVFGHTGVIPFTSITQIPLREAMKIWVYDDLPRRRNKNAVHHARAVIAALAMLSQSRRLQRPDRGLDPAAWGRADIVAYCNRMGHLTATGKQSASRRLAYTRFVRRVLLRFRTLGLAGHGGVLEGMPVDFAIWPEDMPDEPEDAEAGRDLPEAVMRALCAHLDRLEDLSSTETRVATELLIDTGRRPDEIYTLTWDCLESDPDGSPVLVYDNHKAYRLGRRLPIGGETAEVIRRQQQRVRDRFPTTAPAHLKLLPRARTNPEGTKPLNDISAAHRKWVDSLPDLLVPLITTEAGTQVTHLVPFDRARIFTYAYPPLLRPEARRRRSTPRRTQRIDGPPAHHHHPGLLPGRCGATPGGRRPGHGPAVRPARQPGLAHGPEPAGLRARAPCDRGGRHPYGVCREPSNVAAGGHACPLRFRCLGCEHFCTDISYLPDLQAHLADLLRSRERLMSAFEADEWARAQAMPSQEEISRVRRLIDRVSSDLDQLTAEDRAQIDQAVTLVRRSRTVHLGMPRVGQPLPDVRPPRTQPS